MREIDGIEEVVRHIEPYWDKIKENFDNENRHFIELMGQSSDVLGRALKCHLIVENYLDRFLSEKLGLENIDKARLTFFQKATLLPEEGSAASVVKPGIIKLNAIRNRFSHDLEAHPDLVELGPIDELLEIARQGVSFRETIDRIEAFTTIACTWLGLGLIQTQNATIAASATADRKFLASLS